MRRGDVLYYSDDYPVGIAAVAARGVGDLEFIVTGGSLVKKGHSILYKGIRVRDK